MPIGHDVNEKLRQLAALLEDATELAPGVWQGAYGEGVLRFTVLVRLREGGISLRVAPASFLPAPVATHPLVKTRLGDLEDLLTRGSLHVDDLLGAVLELQIDPEDDVQAVMRGLHEDCVLLRAAAGGLAAAAPEQAPSSPSGTYERARARTRAFESAAPSRPAPAPAPRAPQARPAPAPLPPSRSEPTASGLLFSEPLPARPPASGLLSSEPLVPGPPAGGTRSGGLPITEREDPEAWGRQTRPRFVGFPDRRASLVVVAGPDEGRAFELADRDAFCIGRSPHVEVRLEDDVCSRRNSLLRWTDRGTLRIEDLGSSNGTRVNGRVTDRAELLPGDEIEVGWTKLRLELPTHLPSGGASAGGRPSRGSRS